VAWSRDGETLAAGGYARALVGGVGRAFIRRFGRDGRRRGADVPVADSTIFDIRARGDGFVFTAHGPLLGRLSADGRSSTWQAPRTADMRDKVAQAFTSSADAAIAGFGLGDGETKPVVFDLDAAALVDSPPPPPGPTPPSIAGLPVSDWRNND